MAHCEPFGAGSPSAEGLARIREILRSPFALVFALRERRSVALLALGFALFITVNGARTQLCMCGRPGALIGILTAMWLLSAAAAVGGHYIGVFKG